MLANMLSAGVTLAKKVLGPPGAQIAWLSKPFRFSPLSRGHMGLVTTGFPPRRRRKQKEEFTWPLWEHPLACDEIKSLLALSELQAEPPDRGALEPRGINEIFRATRVHIGQGANFKVSFRPARAI